MLLLGQSVRRAADATQQPGTSKVYCTSCRKQCAFSEQCAKCNLPLHTGCARARLCTLCFRAKNIGDQQAGARQGLLKQAEKMTKTSARLHPAPKIGDTVLVPLADVDRSKGDPRNIMAVVVDVKDNNLIQVGNEHGVLRNLLSRNQYSIAKSNFVSLAEVARDKELTVRSFLTAASITGGKGYTRCDCKQGCNTIH